MDLGALLALQRLDTAIEQGVHARDHLVERSAARSAATDVASLVSERTTVLERQAAAQRELDGLESDAADISKTLDRLDKQLKTIVSPREAEAIQHEMANLVARRGELDDRGLELLKESSMSDDEIARLDRAIESARVVADDAERGAVVAESEADRALEALRNERSSAAASLDAASLADYERRRNAFGGIAVATIEHGNCTACHMELSVAETDAIKRLPADAVPECPHCARILVR